MNKSVTNYGFGNENTQVMWDIEHFYSCLHKLCQVTVTELQVACARADRNVQICELPSEGLGVTMQQEILHLGSSTSSVQLCTLEWVGYALIKRNIRTLINVHDVTATDI